MLLVFGGFVLLGALGWKILQLRRAPYDLPLRAVTLCLTCFVLAYPIQLHLSHVEEPLEALLGPGAPRLSQNLLQLVAFYWLMAFFLLSAGGSEARRRARWEVVPLAVAMVAMTVAMLTTPGDQRDHEFATAEMRLLPVAVFYLAGTAYFAYSVGAAGTWARRYGRDARANDPHLARGLLLTSTGLMLCMLSLTARTCYILIRAAGGRVPSVVNTAAVSVVAAGILLFLAGLTYPGLVTRVAAARRWRVHRRAYRELRPLWTLLNASYPQGVLDRVPTGVHGDLLALRHVHRRYYRRVIECRDGLVRISPHLPRDRPETGPESLEEEAAHLRAASEAEAAGSATPAPAVALARPTRGGLDRDVEQLLRLSRALRQR